VKLLQASVIALQTTLWSLVVLDPHVASSSVSSRPGTWAAYPKLVDMD
jgi:hypothetical protein